MKIKFSPTKKEREELLKDTLVHELLHQLMHKQYKKELRNRNKAKKRYGK